VAACVGYFTVRFESPSFFFEVCPEAAPKRSVGHAPGSAERDAPPTAGPRQVVLCLSLAPVLVIFLTRFD
jgi:hypothetical protein